MRVSYLCPQIAETEKVNSEVAPYSASYQRTLIKTVLDDAQRDLSLVSATASGFPRSLLTRRMQVSFKFGPGGEDSADRWLGEDGPRSRSWSLCLHTRQRWHSL